MTTGEAGIEAEAERPGVVDPEDPDARPERTAIEARRGAAVAWRIELPGGGGPLARSGALVIAALSGTGAAAGVPLRGSPGAVLIGLDAATGAIRWRLAIDASEWALIAAVAPAGDGDGGAVIGGAFGGTLRAGAHVVSSGGGADGFVAHVSAAGEVRLLVRMGGPGADGVRGIAAAGDRIAIAGTFSAGADLRGAALDPIDARSPAADGFVAELDAATARPRWIAAFGGELDDGVAGVAIDGRGRVVVAGVARGVVRVHGRALHARGPADALIAWWEPGGAAGPAILLGGAGLDGASAIAAVGDRVVVGAFAGDDARIVALDGGAVVDAWPAAGAGREEIVALAAVPGGFVAGVAHTAGARIGAATIAAPRDPLAGAALVVRPVR